MIEIKCPHDLNQFIIDEPIFENPFPEEECEQRKFYGDCYHCFATAIASRDQQIKKKSKCVLEQIAKEQKTLLDTTKAWSKALEHGDIY